MVTQSLSGIQKMQNKSTHKLTIYLDHGGVNNTVTTYISNPDSAIETLKSSIDSFYRPRWWKRSTMIQISGDKIIVIPINKVLSFSIERL